MDPKLGVAVLIAVAAAAAAAAPLAYAGAGESKWVIPVAAWRGCEGRVGECIDPDEEMMMESEGAHRQLWDANRYISYNAMNKNNIPCSQRGNSYYNCRGNNAANPYRRGCTAITNCARRW